MDDELWLLLSSRFSDPSELHLVPSPVGVYLASRWLEWEVGNGGFAQAAYNIPEWFQPAAAAYSELHKPRAAALIQEALAMIEGEHAFLASKGLQYNAAIPELFAHFEGSDLAALDARIPDDEWWVDEERIAYVRANRRAFCDIQ